MLIGPMLFGHAGIVLGTSVNILNVEECRAEITIPYRLKDHEWNEAKALSRKKKWNEALPILRTIAKQDSRSIPVLMELTSALVHTGHRGEALDLLSEALGWAKDSNKKMLIRRQRELAKMFLTNKEFQIFQDGLNLLFQKKYRSSREKFEKVISEEGENVEVLVRLGQSLLLDGEPKKAVEFLRLAKKYSPYEPEIRLWLARALQQSFLNEEALPEFRASMAELQGLEFAPLWYAESLSAVGQSGMALKILEQDAKAWPFHLASLVNSARLRIQSPHPETQSLWIARKNLQLAMSRVSDSHTSQKNQRELAFDLGPDFTLDTNEIKADMQRLLLQVEGRLSLQRK